MVAEYRGASAQFLCCLTSPLYSREVFPGWCAPWGSLPPSSRRLLVAVAADMSRMVSDQAPRCHQPDSLSWCELVDDVEHEGFVRTRSRFLRAEAMGRAWFLRLAVWYVWRGGCEAVSLRTLQFLHFW